MLQHPSRGRKSPRAGKTHRKWEGKNFSDPACEGSVVDMASLFIDIKFVDPIDFKYICNHCKKRLSDPQQLKCGHRYCKPCIVQLLQERANGRCPACCKEDEQPDAATRDAEDLESGILVSANVFPDNAIRREITRLKCYCPHAEPCPWTGPYGNLEEHLTKECEYADVDCPRNCGQQVARNTLSAHMSADCPERPVTCKHCNEESKAKEQENHLRACKNLRVTCSGCLQKIPQAELAAHQDLNSGTCTRQYTPCPYGCKDLLNKDNMKAHKEQHLMIHMDVVHEKCKSLQEQLAVVPQQLPPLLHQQQLPRSQPILGQQRHDANMADSGIGDSSGIGGSGSNGRNSGTTSGIGGSTSDSGFRDSGISGGNGVKGSSSGKGGVAIGGASSVIRGTTVNSPRSAGSLAAQQVLRLQHSVPSSERAEDQSVASGGQPVVRNKLTVLAEDLVPNMFKAVEVLSHETKGCAALVDTLKNYKKRQLEHTQLMEEKVKAIERRVQIKENRLVELATRVDMLEQVHYDGILLWQITEFARKRKEAISGRTVYVMSQPFFTSRTGYKMCAQAFLNGDGGAKGTHLSIAFVLMKGPYDAVLKWPFIEKVTAMLLDQRSHKGSHVKESLLQDTALQSSKRPTETNPMNPHLQCQRFCTLKDLEDTSRGYLKDDCIFIKMIVDTIE